MRRSTRRLIVMMVSVPLLVLALALLYALGMQHLEGETRSYGEALEWASETLTSTGYGHDDTWHHPVMVGFVITVQFVGAFLVFLLIPIFMLPFIEERFEGRLATELPALEDHVIIYGYGPEVTTLIDELQRARVPVVLIEEDEPQARRLRDRGHRVVLAKLEEDDLDLASLARARAVIANGADHNNAVLTLSAREQGFEGPIVALVESPYRRHPMVQAGATAAFTPIHMLAAAVAARASAKISPRVAGAHPLGRHLEVAELRIHPGSALAGKTLAQADLRAVTGATVIGQWAGGVLEPQPSANALLAPGTILVVAGSRESIANLGKIARPISESGPIVVVGYGVLGEKVTALLKMSGEDVKVVDIQSRDGVDVVGDALDRQVLLEAGVREARAVILSMGSDSATMFATTVLRNAAPEVPIIATVSRVGNISRVHRAGADFALSVSQVAGQILAHHVLGQESFALERELKLAVVAPGALAGQNLVDSAIRERTGCSIVAVERGDRVIVEFGREFVFAPDDAIYISGTAESIDDYHELFPGARPSAPRTAGGDADANVDEGDEGVEA